MLKQLVKNRRYFFGEVSTMIRMNRLSTFFSYLSTVMIFFLLGILISLNWVGEGVIARLQEEAEITVYYSPDLDEEGLKLLQGKIATLEGVQGITWISEEEAYTRMEALLGTEAEVLSYFEENPFSPYLEVKAEMTAIGPLAEEIKNLDNVSYLRDNQEILDRLTSIIQLVEGLSLLILGAAGISTLVILSHMIRLGVYHHREQINTLRLLGAPKAFIDLPFYLQGLLVTLGGTLTAAGFIAILLQIIYQHLATPLPFIPLPPLANLLPSLVGILVAFGGILGVLGCTFGLSSAKKTGASALAK